MTREGMLAVTVTVAVLLCACAQATPGAIGEEGEGSAPGVEPPAARGGDLDPGSDPDSDPDPNPDSRLPTPDPDSDAQELVTRPRDLECVSAIAVSPGHVASSWRATLLLDGDASHATLVETPRFQSHDGVWGGETEPEIHDAQLHARGPRAFAGDAGSGVAIELVGDAPFFSAVLQLEGTSTELLCWDRIAIFGSAWGSQPVLLPRFDAARGECVNAEGAPVARQALPLEFVLDTGYGECADLRGVALNAGDFAYPDLSLDLRGADLGAASLQFANLTGSFEGARLGALDYGYASVSGSIDDATELPAQGDCTVTDSTWGGRSVTCQR